MSSLPRCWMSWRFTLTFIVQDVTKDTKHIKKSLFLFRVYLYTSLWHYRFFLTWAEVRLCLGWLIFFFLKKQCFHKCISVCLSALQLTMHTVSGTKKQARGTACRPQRQDFCEAQMSERLQNISAALKVPISTEASIILQWKKFGTTRTLQKAGCPNKLSNQGRTIVREVTKNPVVGHSSADWVDNSLSSLQNTWQPTCSFK